MSLLLLSHCLIVYIFVFLTYWYIQVPLLTIDHLLGMCVLMNYRTGKSLDCSCRWQWHQRLFWVHPLCRWLGLEVVHSQQLHIKKVLTIWLVAMRWNAMLRFLYSKHTPPPPPSLPPSLSSSLPPFLFFPILYRSFSLMYTYKPILLRQVGALPDHFPSSWQVLVLTPTRENPVLQV